MEIYQKYLNYTISNKFSKKIVKKSIIIFKYIFYTLLSGEYYYLAKFCYIISLLIYNKAMSKPFYRVMLSICLLLKGYLAFCFKRSSDATAPTSPNA